MTRARKTHPTRPRGTASAVNLRHGESGGGVIKFATPEYKAWQSMIARCCVPSNRAYARYGGSGISVCERWRHSYEAFLSDMGRKPTVGHSLDRYPNGSGNYEPGNCRWATITQQARNRRTNRLMTHRGETRTATEWAESAGISLQILSYRLKKGWDIEMALMTPPQASKSHKR